MSGGIPTQADSGETMLNEKPKPRDLPRIGEIFGTYRIERELGHGGMGAVYAAEHLESGRHVALKVLSHKLDSPEARSRFLREGRLAASINHPNSVYVFGTDEIEGTPVISMELISGGTLQERVQRSGPLPVGEAVDAILQIIAGLEAAQAIGILHRDIKPANCFEDMDGTVKIGDFGLSISTAARGESQLTLPGDFMGTPAFCSPEQIRGDELNVRSDMYAVGVTLFYLLTGRTPFEGKHMVQLLANALEKPAPSPSQFRPEIPQSLSHVVLRCLNKQAGERFGSYEELRRALLPFNSTAQSPATLRLRFVAYIGDTILFTLVNWMVMFWFILDAVDFSNFQNTYLAYYIVGVGYFVMKLLYFSILEGVWGASIGKALVGLRVVRLNRSAPGIPCALGRFILLSLPELLFLVSELYDIKGDGNLLLIYGMIALWGVLTPAIFFTARRSNGFAAVHDLLTGTRVIQKSAYQPRVVISKTEGPVATTEAMPKLGPYHVMEALSTGDEGTLSLGYDTQLLRKVWIRQKKAGEPPVPQILRNIARSGRLRWLQGECNENESWDAYEAVNGTPLVSLLNERQSWQTVRLWLHDLAVELEAAEKNNTMPGVLALDRVWITSEGRAKLLDFAVARHSDVESDEPPHAHASVNNVLECSSRHCNIELPNIFLNQVAMSTLEGRIASKEEASSRAVSAPLALSARAFLHDLITPSAGGNLTAKLKQLLLEKPCISRWKRFAMIMTSAGPAVVFGLLTAAIIPFSQGWMKDYQELMSLSICMMSYQELELGKNPTNDAKFDVPEAKAALEVYIAGHYGHIIRDPKMGTSPIFTAIFKPDQRTSLERMIREHPHPTEEEQKKANATVKPWLVELESTITTSSTELGKLAAIELHPEEPATITTEPGKTTTPMIEPEKLITITTEAWKSVADYSSVKNTSLNCFITLLIMIAVGSLVCSLTFCRGPLFRILGIAVVTDDGSEASRLRMLGRGLIAWSPVLLSVVLIRLSDHTKSPYLAPSVLIGASFIVAIAFISRERSLQDRLAGTWLVPMN